MGPKRAGSNGDRLDATPRRGRERKPPDALFRDGLESSQTCAWSDRAGSIDDCPLP